MIAYGIAIFWYVFLCFPHKRITHKKCVRIFWRPGPRPGAVPDPGGGWSVVCIVCYVLLLFCYVFCTPLQVLICFFNVFPMCFLSCLKFVLVFIGLITFLKFLSYAWIRQNCTLYLYNENFALGASAGLCRLRGARGCVAGGGGPAIQRLAVASVHMYIMIN